MIVKFYLDMNPFDSSLLFFCFIAPLKMGIHTLLVESRFFSVKFMKDVVSMKHWYRQFLHAFKTLLFPLILLQFLRTLFLPNPFDIFLLFLLFLAYVGFLLDIF